MKKFVTLIVFAMCSNAALAQDTIPANVVPVAQRIINKKTGKVERIFVRKIKVKKGYVVRQANGTYLVNGKMMRLDNFNYQDTLVKL